jgi:TolB-like protein/tetratricopeptide (TPR) repeat protein
MRRIPQSTAASAINDTPGRDHVFVFLGLGRLDMSGSDEAAIRTELERILSSPAFDASSRNRQFLGYVVEEALAGRADRIKAYTIATAVFGRQADFDPQLDSIVRIEAGRLRRALERFYLMAGPGAGTRISIPRGSYVPSFEAAEEPAARAAPAVARRSGPAILVRPFDEEGDHSSYPNFTRGFTRQVIVGLTRYTELLVFGVDTAMSQDAPGGPLDPDYVVTGGTCLSADRFTADVLLADARTGRYVWGGSFTHRLDPAAIATARDEVASAVVRILAQPYGALYAHKAPEVDGKPGRSLTAYDCVIRFYQYWRTYDRGMFDMLRQDLEEAVQREPCFADAYACLSLLLADGYRYGYAAPGEREACLARALALGRRAVDLAPLSSRSHHALGMAFWFGGDVRSAVAALEAGLHLNPNDTDIMAELGVRYANLADWERAVPLLEGSYERNPAQPSTYRIGLALWHLWHGRFEAALDEARKVDAPGVVYGHAAAAVAAAELGLWHDAAAAIRALRAINPDYLLHAEADLRQRNLHPRLVALVTAGLAKAAAAGAPPVMACAG